MANENYSNFTRTKPNKGFYQLDLVAIDSMLLAEFCDFFLFGFQFAVIINN